MWNITNVKTPNIGQKKRDDSRQPIREPMDENLLYLLQFASWVKDWKNQSKLLLTHETTTEVHQTCTTLVGLTRDMLDEKQFEYILLGQLQSDAIEKRFGWHRKLSGANYFVSVQQVLEAEKSIRVRSLIKFSHFNIHEAMSAMADSAEKKVIDVEARVEEMLSTLTDRQLSCECKDIGHNNIIFYVAGFIARSVTSNVRNHFCKELFIASNGASTMGLEDDGNSDLICQETKKDAGFFAQVNRGGLCIPTELVRLSCLYIWNFYQTLDRSELLAKVYASTSPIKDSFHRNDDHPHGKQRAL